jgi:hypothetical protein
MFLEAKGRIPKRWLDNFLDASNVKSALAVLDRADRSRDRWLLRWVLQSCYHASTYSKESDPALSQRKRSANFREASGDQRNP